MQQESTYDYDLFVSYVDADQAWVRDFLLPELGIPAERLITADDFVLGAPTVSEFERAILTSRRTLLVFSPEYVVDELAQFVEQLSSTVAVLSRTNRLVPITLRACEVPPRITFRVVLDCTVEAHWSAAMARLREQFKLPDPPPASIACPYPGILPFEQAQAHFYGREREISDMEQALHGQKLLFVIGPSGSGKTSLLRAGLWPRLQKSQPGFWRFLEMRPGDHPTMTLAGLLPGDLSRPHEVIATALAHPPPAQRLLLVIDQFEELFTQTDRDMQERFIQALKALRSQQTCALVVAIRSDFSQSLKLSSLWEPSRSELINLLPLGEAALREAITRPAANVGVYVEPALVNQLLNDARNQLGVMPLLQETMEQLWSKRQRNLLTLSAYEQLGQHGRSGLATAVAEKAGTTYNNLTPDQRKIARRVFVDLVNIAEGCDDTRRKMPLDKLRRRADNPVDFEQVLEQLTEKRLVIRSGDNDQSQFVELSHSILITAWPEFETWLKENREVEIQTRQLNEAVTKWNPRSSDDSFLYTGSRLAEAERLAQTHALEIDDPVREFLDASQRLEAIRVRARYVGQAAGGALGAALGYGVLFGLSFAIAELRSTGALDVAVLLVTTLSILPVGALVGFAVGLSLWRWRRQPDLRVIASGLIGALTGSLAYGLYRLLTDPPGLFDPRALAVGALLGAGIGCGAGVDVRLRLRGMLLGGAAGAALALPFGLYTPSLSLAAPLLIGAGLALGGLTALGFQATAVDERERIVL